MVPPSVFEQQARIFSGARFLHLYLSPGCLGATASPEFCHQNPEVTRGCIILHPGTDYTLLIKRIHHIVKSVNPPAWGISDIPPHTWTGWGVKLFIPMNGPRILKELWETVGEQIFHLEVRLVPPAQDIDENWFCVTAEQHMALQNYRGDAEVDLYARFKEVDP